MKSWHWYGLVYVQDGAIQLGAVTRATGVGDWQAWLKHLDREDELLGNYPTPEACQHAIEQACESI